MVVWNLCPTIIHGYPLWKKSVSPTPTHKVLQGTITYIVLIMAVWFLACIVASAAITTAIRFWWEGQVGHPHTLSLSPFSDSPLCTHAFIQLQVQKIFTKIGLLWCESTELRWLVSECKRENDICFPLRTMLESLKGERTTGVENRHAIVQGNSSSTIWSHTTSLPCRPFCQKTRHTLASEYLFEDWR